MSLAWHIAKKDLRRIALPAGALVGFVLVTAIWFSRVHLSAETVAAHDELSWINGISAVAAWTVGMQIVMSLLLAGHLVLEDPVLGTTNFWQTRPIGRGRLLAAKAIAGGLALVVAPAVALIPVWLTAGFGLGELARAAAGFAALQMLLVLVAFLFASLTRTIAEFFFSTLAASVVFALAVAKPRSFGWGTELGANVELTRMYLVVGWSLLIVVCLVVHQFLTRRTRLGWSLLVAGIVAVHLVRVYWPRDLSSYFQAEPWPPATGDDLTKAVAVEKISIDRNGLPTVAVRLDAGKDGRVFVPQSGDVQLRWPDGRVVRLALKPGNQWGADAAMRLAGIKSGAGAIEWEMTGTADGGKISATAPAPGLSGSLALSRVHGAVLLEVPVRAGAQARNGSSEFRIVAIDEGSGDERPTVAVEEREAWFRREAGEVGWRNRPTEEPRLACYFLINRATGTVQRLRSIQQGAAELGKLLVRTRKLEFSFPEKLAGWRDGTMLVKVRFEEERRLTREVAAERVTLVAEEANQ